MKVVLSHRPERIAAVVLVALGGYLAWVILVQHPDQRLLLVEMFAAAVVIGAIITWGLVRHRAGRTLQWLARQVRQCSRSQAGGEILLDAQPAHGEWTGLMSTDLAAIRTELQTLRRENHVLRISNRMAIDERNRIEEIMLYISDAVLVINRYGELVSANESAERLLGFRLTRSSRKPVEDILPGGSLSRQIAEACRSGKVPAGPMVEHCLSRDGSDRTYRAHMHVLRGPRQVRQGLVVVLHDISREKQIEQAKAEFLSNVSHELKTPLSSIKAYVEMLLDGEASGEEVPQFHQIIAGEADRLERLIDRTLSLSRIELVTDRIVREPVSMAALVRQVIQTVTPQARAKHIELAQEVPPVFYQVEVDFDLLCQAMLNLLTNAIKYTPDGGSVWIRVRIEENRQRVLLDIADTGVGIAANELPRIFEKFYRVRATKEMGAGTGLGLPLARYIIEQIHGGQLSVASEPNQGTTFTVELPLVA